MSHRIPRSHRISRRTWLRGSTLAAAGLAGTALAGCAAPSDRGIADISVFAGSLPESTPTGVGVHAMVDHLNASGTGFEATAFFDTSLGSASSMINALQEGTIDVAVSGSSYFSGLVPQIQAFELPFVFEDLEHARRATGPGAARDHLHELFEATKIVGLSVWENGMRQLTNNVRAIHEPADLQGIKIRTLPSPIQQAAWKAMGGLPQAIDASELYTALQQGTVQAQENPLAEIEFRKFYEVQNHLSMTSHVYTPFMMGVSRRTWNRLTQEQRTALEEAAEVGRAAQLDANDVATEKARTVLEDNGVAFVDDPDREAFRELGTSVWTQFTDAYGTELLDLVQGM
ncbi:DctP family TRAP transporter solute-binding subunit [Brachybacterium hainanense]|uniref:DctP family TRAP transporter solute-binding subunit n=1 Tax=Brachybacterium hainanense TaxID=1541174 RepID=A0ABV6R8B8_9MICO